jgi:uncharacterized protein DUF4157
MGDSRTGAGRKPGSKSRGPARSPQPSADRRAGGEKAGRGPAAPLGPFYSAGPAIGLGVPVQEKLAVGHVGDPYEREADAVAERVVTGESVPAISPVAASQLGQSTQRATDPEEKKPAQKATAPAKEEKKPTPVQTAAAPAKEEKKPAPVQAATAPAKEEKKPTPVQTATAPAKEEKKPTPVQTAAAPAKEEKKPTPVQTATAPAKEEKKPTPVQKATAPAKEEKKPTAVQKAVDSDSGTDTEEDRREEEPVQMLASGPTADEDAAERAIQTKGPGQPLDPGTRSTLEPGIGADLGDVRVHTDAAAHDAAAALGARAFTHGQDIWLGAGESPADTHLMAHEATHVVQQGGSLQRQVVQRQASGPADSSTAATKTADGTNPGVVKEGEQKIEYPTLKVPPFKAQKAPYRKRTLKRSKEYKKDERPTGDQDQKNVWDKSLEGDASQIGHTIEAKIGQVEADKPYALKHSKSGFFLIGKPAELKQAAARPLWNRQGQPQPKDVDHVVELQISGWPGTEAAWANTAGEDGNLELLDSRANRQSGFAILRAVNANVKSTRERYWRKPAKQADLPAGADPSFWVRPKEPLLSEIKARYDLVFQSATEGEAVAGDTTNVWTWKEIKDAEHLKNFERSTEALAGEDQWTVFATPQGGVPHTLGPPYDGKERAPTAAEAGANWLKPFTVSAVNLKAPTAAGSGQGDPVGYLKLALPFAPAKNLGLGGGSTPTIAVARQPALPNAAYLDSDAIMSVWRTAYVKGLSPIEITSWGVVPNKGFVARGAILPDVPIFQLLAIDLVVEGDDVAFSRVFDVGDFKLPGPIQVTDSDLEVRAGPNGLGVTGQVSFEIQGVGRGGLKGVASTQSGLGLEGAFNFDTTLFDPAGIKMWYREGEFGAKGTIGIKAKTVKGIKSATVTAQFDKGVLSASGKAALDVPGLEQGDLAVTYSETAGLAIAGTLRLKPGIPGIKNGSADVSVVKKPDADGYKVTAHGQAEPAIPGVNVKLGVTYDDGALGIEGTAAYERGMLKGSLTLGVTNRPLDAGGQPGGEPTNTLKAYGGGSVTVRIAPWLEGTVGIKLLPNGEIELAGKIELPSTLDIFPEKTLDKEIFKIGIDIPIVGVSVAGTRVGIFANISGGLTASAGVGPGQLQELGLAVTYNPDHEDETHVTGGAKLHIPARAGLRLFVSGEVGVGLLIVSASGGLELGGTLGLEGAVDAGVQVDWTPARGLVLDAMASISVEPKFTFDITGFVKVEASLLFTKFELYGKRWQLASFEYGSGLRFGVRFPVHYEEGKPFDLSLSDLEFDVPQIDPKSLLTGLIDQIA